MSASNAPRGRQRSPPHLLFVLSTCIVYPPAPSRGRSGGLKGVGGSREGVTEARPCAPETAGSNQPFRLVDVVPYEEDDESPFGGVLEVKARGGVARTPGGRLAQG